MAISEPWVWINRQLQQKFGSNCSLHDIVDAMFPTLTKWTISRIIQKAMPIILTKFSTKCGSYQCCSNWFEIWYSQLQLLMAKTPITTHYNYTDSWTVMITITSKLCRLQLLFNYIRLWERERDFALD